MKRIYCPLLLFIYDICYNDIIVYVCAAMALRMTKFRIDRREEDNELFKWDQFDDKMRDRATEELLRFMAMFSSAAAIVCFTGCLVNQLDMTLPLVLLTFMMVILICWQYKRRKNVKRWGEAVRTGKEVFRIGMNQPTEEERMGVKPEQGKKAKKKKKNDKKGNYRH